MPGWNLQDYEPVEDRIRAFWTEHPDGRITTELAHVGTDGYIVKACVWRDGTYVTARIDVGDGMTVNGERSRVAAATLPDATGYAQEAVTERGVNATSALENCETSAIGRALANLGYAAKGKRPSREEMSKASPPSERTAVPSIPSRDTSAASPGAGVASGGETPVPSASGVEAAQTTGDNERRAVGQASSPASTSDEPAASQDAAASGGVTAEGYGEGSEAGPPAPLQQMADGDQPATSEQWERLRAVCGDSMQKAVNRLNKVNSTSYTKQTAVVGATRQEVANAITGEAA